jgi:hypothetical protein
VSEGPALRGTLLATLKSRSRPAINERLNETEIDMAETHPIRLNQSEVNQQARKFFGSDGIGMDLVVDEPQQLRFESDSGFIQLRARPDTNNQVRLTIDHKGMNEEIRQFRRLLARQAAGQTHE